MRTEDIDVAVGPIQAGGAVWTIVVTRDHIIQDGEPVRYFIDRRRGEILVSSPRDSTRHAEVLCLVFNLTDALAEVEAARRRPPAKAK